MTPRLQEQFGYAYDKAWNLQFRTNNAMVETFGVNSLNELTNFSRSGTLTVGGIATEPSGNAPRNAYPGVSSVTVNGQAAVVYGDGSFAAAGLTPADGWNSYTAIAQDNVWPNGRWDTNTVTAYLPASASYTYDLNGNLLSDGRRNFAYDDENQLISVWVANGWSNSFAYDGLLRKRIEKDYAWNGSTWIETNEVHFIYDGYLVLQERYYDPQHPTDIPLDSITYTRGEDLSGTLQGAGGIGGLLARTDMGQWIGNDANANAYYINDGRGNIIGLVNTNGWRVAHYKYDPYGNLLAESGPLAAANKYRFSSKEWDSQAGLYYYLYRFYDPNLQRWVNQDPLGKLGAETLLNVGRRASRQQPAELAEGPNLYAFVGNDPVDVLDTDGRGKYKLPPPGPTKLPPPIIPPTPKPPLWKRCIKGLGKFWLINCGACDTGLAQIELQCIGYKGMGYGDYNSCVCDFYKNNWALQASCDNCVNPSGFGPSMSQMLGCGK
jgi:RHS repeat-associated protein